MQASVEAYPQRSQHHPNKRGLWKALLLTSLKHSKSGATSFDIEPALNWSHQTASATLSKLEEAGMIVRNGDTRLSPSGHEACVYFDLDYVPVEDREPVIRRREIVVDWQAIQEERNESRTAAALFTSLVNLLN